MSEMIDRKRPLIGTLILSRHEMDRYKPFKELKELGNWPPPDDLLATKPIIPLIKELGDNIVGCEIGVNFGIGVIYTLDEVPAIKKIYGIDPYIGTDGVVILSQAKECFLRNMKDG